MRIAGIDELIADMTRLNREQAKQMKAIIKKAAAPVLIKAKNDAPVATGELRRSLQLGFEKVKKQGKSVINIRSKKGRAIDSRGVPYAQFVESGRSSGNRGVVPPKPFMKPAIETFYDNVKKEIEDELLQIFNETMRG